MPHAPDIPSATLFDFSIQVGDRLYIASSDAGFPAYPQITLAANLLVSAIDFEGTVDGFLFSIQRGLATHFPVSFPGGPDLRFGLIGRVALDDEPATAALVTLSLRPVPWLGRRPRRRSDSAPNSR